MNTVLIKKIQKTKETKVQAEEWIRNSEVVKFLKAETNKLVEKIREQQRTILNLEYFKANYDKLKHQKITAE